jgi:cell division protein FtsN
MNNYLLSILKEVNTIIIPGIGALTITNAATGEIMFMPYLKFDDGKLAQHISEKESIDLNDAKNLVAKYVREIEAQLNIGESYDMYQFGSFVKSSEGEIEFTQWNKENDSESDKNVIDNATYDSETAARTDTSIDTNEMIPELVDEKRIIETPIIDPKTTKEEEIQTIDETTTIQAVAIDASDSYIEFEQKEEGVIFPISKKITHQTIIQPAYTEEQQWNDDLDLPPINAKIERPKKPIIEKVQKDKKQKSPAKVIILTLLFLLIAGGTTTILIRDQLGITIPFLSASKKSTDDKSKAVKEETEPEKSTNIKTKIEDTEGNAAMQTPIEEELAEQSASNSSDIIQTSTGQIDKNKPYHIIVGAFTALSNAERYQKKLTVGGHASVIIGKFDQLYIVSISSHSSQDEANNKLNEAKVISANAWIIRFP